MVKCVGINFISLKSKIGHCVDIMDISYLPTHSKFYRDFDNNNNMEQLMVTTIIIVKLPYHNKTSLLNSDE